ncbi:hypothetical protein ASE74_20700 [Pedobacter sp. Leaf216]|nr:hypothetical protein ASE74_20700 [Pedobacter sp. Leaf216]
MVEQALKPSNQLAVPFLLLSTDAVSSGMGEAGNALLSDNSTAEPNTAMANFLERRFGVSITYTPWLRELVRDRKLMFAGGFYRFESQMTMTASLNYLSYGQIDLIDINNVNMGSIQPTEYVGSVGISKGFGSKFSLGMKLKLIHSNLYTGADAAVSRQAGTAYCVNVSAFQRFPLNSFHNSEIAVSVNIENIGPKISYYNRADQRSFLPSNLKIGTAFKTRTTAEGEIGIALDFNKLLVPEKPLNADASVMQSIVSSFSPGGGLGIGDIGASIGAQFCYRKTLSFRLGYNLQGDERSPGSFFSAGMGLKRKKIGLNLAYLSGNPQRTFLSNTMRFTLDYSM